MSIKNIQFNFRIDHQSAIEIENKRKRSKLSKAEFARRAMLLIEINKLKNFKDKE
tara:strand:- start:33566 stop:33730 length:165 start_codon:yes stop_codon:yes gene_type:complete